MVNVHRKPIHSFGERYKAIGQEIASALDPTRNIDAQTIEVLKRNIGGDQSFERWQDKMKSYHNSGATSCGKIWGSEYIAYRCRTCAFNSCMSLCAPCFEAGDHEGHDFNMFKSGAGGACDCGDTNVMCEKGVCPKHVSKVIVAPNPPAEALEPCTPIISSIVYRLLHELRVKFQDNKREQIEAFLKDRLEKEERSRSTTSSTRTPNSPQDIPVPPPPEDVERMTESPLPTEFGQDEPMPGDEITVQSPPPEGGTAERPDDIVPLELVAAGLMDAESPEVEEMDTDILDTDEFIDPTEENANERGAELLRRIGEAHGHRNEIENDLRQVHFNREPEFNAGFSLLVDFLIQLIQIGTTLQDVVVSVLFQSLADFESCERPEMNHENQEIFRRTRDYVYEKLRALNNYVHEDDEKCTAALRFDLSSSSTVLEEFAFWLSRMHFPDTLNNFLLHLLPNDAYKEQLTGCFVKNYVFTAKSLTISNEPDSLANRIVHISVQLLSNEALVMRMIKERSLLEVFIQSLGLLFRQTLKAGIDKRKVVDCRHEIVQQTVYWPIISDLNNCLHHPSVARKLVESSNLYYEYLRIINWFTGMDVQSRAIGDHISYDRLFYVSFYLEKEGSAVPLSGIISMLTGKEHFENEPRWKNTVTSTWKCLMRAYRDFFVSKSSGKVDPDTITFSISLPRQMSAIIYHLRKSLPGLGWKEFFSFERDQLESFLHTAQHTIAGMHEVRARVWVRNGDNTRSLVHVYRSASFSGTTFDLDLHLVQLVWAYLPPNLLVQQLFERLRVWKMIKSDEIDEAIDDICSDTTLDESKIASLLESAMITILTTIGVEKFTTEITPIEQLEKEVICVLAARDRGHSDLADQIPGLSDVQEYDVSNFKLKSSDLDEVLDRVATFNKPKDLGEGSYSLSDAGWAKYDPIFTLHRCVLVEDLMRCRQKHYLKLRGKRTEKDVNRLIGLNYRPLPKLSDMYRGLYDVLKSSLLHSICFLTFWHHIQDEECFRSSMVAYCLIILDWAIDTSDYGNVKDTDPESGWSLYSSDCIMTNSMQEIEGKGCMLDLLVKLCYHKNYKKEDDNEGFNGSADSDMLNLIKRIILKFSNKSATCQTKINAVRAQYEANEEKRRAKNNKDSGTKVANKKLMAQEARKRALEKMKKKSAAFSTENKADLEGMGSPFRNISDFRFIKNPYEKSQWKHQTLTVQSVAFAAKTFVKALFKLSYVQACVKIILEHNLFSPSDLSSDLPPKTKVIFSTIASIIRDEEAAFGVNALGEYISSSVLTKSALLEKIQQYMTPFIKMSALLCHHVFPYSHSIEPDLKWSTKHDVFSLCSYIGIIPELANNDAINELTEAKFDLVDLFFEPVPFIQNLLQNYLHAANLNTKKLPPGKNNNKKSFLSNSAAVLLKPVFFNKPQLLKPPKLFRDLLNSCLKTPCQACGKLPKKSVICLVCGELICYNEHDNRSQADNPCHEAGHISPIKSHIDKCSAGNGIFFVLFDVSIMIIRNNMILRRWGSIYLDKYEEEDFKIRRGKPLYLSETRFNILEKIWISSAFPRFVSLRKTTPK
ncbi:Oidioi.mRNA.OKI2018_I69.PAR.g12296.t1.cds [Oikopleura dioica]|uniref:E3 ubiquitin-protein ligase n=1 Tax=Oikopleura dioica TaxID=34765 RepID=A0ABN7RZX9_OIKDI|nr:Oidioi.mRNA.OKI2018_I69.PAR.g12296.t1.cds [Oikopleura dioica]